MGRLPVALIVAFVVSLCLHAFALFGPDIDLAFAPETPLLVAELRPLPAQPESPQAVSPPSPKPNKPKAKTARPVKPRPEMRNSQVEHDSVAPATPVMTVPESSGSAEPGQTVSAQDVAPADDASSSVSQSSQSQPSPVSESPPAPRLPPRGMIRFRVDKGDSNFEIGFARQQWEFDAGRYRLRSVVETTGLVWLFRSLHIEMESVGQYSESNGLQPDVFGVIGNGQRAKEKALFDWESMKVRVGNRPEQALNPGAQDLLSFYYQVGFMNIAPGEAGTLPVASGKKYRIYRLENLGDEDIEVPLGTLRARHLRAPGENTTELWLAYDYRLLPVKIRHVDSDGGVLVQVATDIQFGQ